MEVEKGEQLDAARRLLDLEVREISLVDRPAILREFLIFKNVDGEGTATLTDTSGVELTESLRESLVKVKKGLEDANIEGTEGAILFLSNVLEGNLPISKGEEMTTNNQEAAAGGTNVVKNEAAATTQTPAAAENASQVAPAQTQQVERQKSVDAASAAAAQTEQVQPDFMADLAAVIMKGRSFTPSRVDAMKSTIEQLTDLMKEVAPEELAKLVDKIAAELPTSPKFRGAVEPMDAPGPKKDAPKRGPMFKSEDEVPAWAAALQKSISDLTEKVAATDTKIATIEKARTPSHAVEQDGTDDNKQQVKKSLFAGVLGLQ